MKYGKDYKFMTACIPWADEIETATLCKPQAEGWVLPGGRRTTNEVEVRKLAYKLSVMIGKNRPLRSICND